MTDSEAAIIINSCNARAIVRCNCGSCVGVHFEDPLIRSDRIDGSDEVVISPGLLKGEEVMLAFMNDGRIGLVRTGEGIDPKKYSLEEEFFGREEKVG